MTAPAEEGYCGLCGRLLPWAMIESRVELPVLLSRAAGGDTMLTVSDLARRLRAAHKTVARRQSAMHEAKSRFLELVAEARGQGWSYDRLALELGVTKGRAQQLVKDLERRVAP